MLTCEFAMSLQLARFAEADPSKVEVHMCTNMQPFKQKMEKINLGSNNLHSQCLIVSF